MTLLNWDNTWSLLLMTDNTYKHSTYNNRSLLHLRWRDNTYKHLTYNSLYTGLRWQDKTYKHLTYNRALLLAEMTGQHLHTFNIYQISTTGPRWRDNTYKQLTYNRSLLMCRDEHIYKHLTYNRSLLLCRDDGTTPTNIQHIITDLYYWAEMTGQHLQTFNI